MRPALKLLILIAVIVTLAGPAGWKVVRQAENDKGLGLHDRTSRPKRAGFEHVPGHILESGRLDLGRRRVTARLLPAGCTECVAASRLERFSPALNRSR